MTDLKEDNNENWKKTLRSAIITALTGDPPEKERACAEIGYYYQCYAPASLYKYYRDTSLNFEAMRDNKMWYSAPCNFNDVFDCDISINEKEIFNSIILQLLPDKRGIRPGSSMWKQLEKETRQQLRSLQSVLEESRNTTGVSCLSESDESLLMWAHYANNHRGMCVEYELMQINEQLGFSPVPIVYSDDRACFRSLNEDTIEADSTSVLIESLTSKSPEWSYEKEWRIIRDNVACGDKWDIERNGALLDMIRPSSVVLGCQAKMDFEKTVREYCENSKINLYKMKKDESLYRLKKTPILQFDN